MTFRPNLTIARMKVDAMAFSLLVDDLHGMRCRYQIRRRVDDALHGGLPAALLPVVDEILPGASAA